MQLCPASANRRCHLFHGVLQAGRFVDDDARVAAELQQDPLLAGTRLHGPADRRRPGEGQQLVARVGHQSIAGFAVHRQHTEGAAGKTGLLEQRGQP
jgi:hypothetical protein